MFRVSLYIYLLFSSFSMIVFFLPLYLQQKGLDSGQIGTIIAGGALISMFSQPFWGFVSDKRKTVKHILLLLMICSLFVSMGLFSMNTFLTIMIFYIAFMFFKSGVIPLTETLCVTYAQDHNKEYGRIRLWGEIGVGVTALLLGILMERFGIDYIWMMYTISLSVAIIAALVIKDTKATAKPINLPDLGKLFSQPRFIWFLTLVLIIAIPHRMNDSMLALFLSDLGATESQLGTAWLVATLSTVPTLFLIGKVIKKWNEFSVFIIAAILYTGRWIIYSLADSPNVLIVSQALHSITFPLFLVASIQYLSTIVPRHMRATGLAAFSVTFGGIGGIIGSAGGGFIIEYYGPNWAYGIGSIFALVGAIAAIATYIMNRNKLLEPIIDDEADEVKEVG